jgi:GAF domain-containing protein
MLKTESQKYAIIPPQKLEELVSALAEINKQSREGKSLEEILEIAGNWLGQIINCSRTSILVKEEELEKETYIVKTDADGGKSSSLRGLQLSITNNSYWQRIASTSGAIVATDVARMSELGEQTQQIVKTLGINSMLAIATRYEDKANGIIWLQEAEPSREWTWEKTVLEIVADGIAIAINYSQPKKSDRHGKGNSLLQLIVSQIRDSHDLETILTTTVRGARQLLTGDRAVIYEFKERWEGSVIVEDIVGPWDSVLETGTDKCFSEGYARLYKAGRVRAIDDIHNSGLDPCHIGLLERLQVRANLVVPIIIGKKDPDSENYLWGLLIVHQCRSPRQWQQQEMDLLQELADRVAIAINQAILRDCNRRQAEREALLRLITNQIRRTLDLDTILQTAVYEVRQLLDTDRVVIYKFLEGWDGEVVVEDLIVPWPEGFQERIKDNCFSGEYSQLYLKGRVRGIHDIYNCGLDRCHANFLANLQVKANLIVPIVFGRENSTNSETTEPRLWGLLIAHHCRSIRHWDLEEITLLEKLGEQLAVAIYQAELYQQVKHSAVKFQTQAQKLQQTVDELQATQLQLIQSEKMSSLGKMVGGIAHEINNPNNFIHANLYHARNYAKALFDFIDRCVKVSPEAGNLYEELKEELELDYIREDFPELIKSMQQGSDRISSIVKTMRKFSHLDEAEHKLIDLNESIESSLGMLEHRLPEIKLNKQYANLPKIECLAGAINQVFFNLINNALDAIEEKGEDGEITIISKKTASDKAIVSIRDSGSGIPPQIQKQIFDPFFTTKDPGKGTGLGLSICYQVVNSHRGEIRCLSEVGKGTEFIVELPIN